MKKLLSLLMVLCCAIGASAQQGWQARTGQSQDRTVVIADFSVTNGAAAYQGNWRIGVFVGDECRLVTQDNATDVLTSVNNQQFLMLEVPGNFDNENDEGKAITIKVRSSMADVYTLTPDQTLTWSAETTYGVGSGPRVQLTLTLPTSITLGEFTTQVGEQVDLKSHVSPANAQLPENLIWYVGENYYQREDYAQFATVSGSVMTALKPNLVNGENQYIPYGFVINGGNYTPLIINGEPVANGQFKIEQPATTLTILSETFEVEKDHADELTDFMKYKSYRTTPTEITEEVKWEIEDATYIVEQQGKWNPAKGGTTRIRPYIERTGGNLYPEGNKWITVTIIVPVDGITLNWPKEGNDYVSFKANVGDEFYARLASRVTVQPADATDATFSFVLKDNDGAQYLTVDNAENKLTAIKAGSTTLAIRPNGQGGENYEVVIPVEIFDPLKEVSFTEDPLVFNTQDNITIDNVRNGIRQNIVWQQTGKTLQDGTIAVTGVLTGSGTFSANGPMLNLDNTELPKGESTVTVTLGWNDYSQYDGTEASILKTWNEGQSFTVKILMGLDHFVITVTPNATDPTRGTITLTPVPADADFNWADYADILNIRSMNYDATWHTIDMNGAGEGNYTYVGLLPGMYEAYSQMAEDSEEFEVPAKVSFASGWQWKSNPYGFMESNKMLYSYFGNNLVEARTQDKLLYNDPEWRYWGSLYDAQGIAIAQAQMYKVKMGAAAETWLRGGEQAERNAYQVAQGWNWIGSPYFYKRLIENAVEQPVEGMVIVGKTGSAEYSGSAWSGDLKTIDPEQGYYVYLPNEGTDEFVLNCEVYGMQQGDETPAGARLMSQSVWSYDHSRFAGNLTVVAEVSNLDQPEQYTIGAFVDGECRGEGIFEDGRAFITVHTDGGEQVALRLHNELTGEYTDIDQTISTTAMRLGSLKAPVQLTAQGVVTGISSVERTAQSAERYDLGGRTVKDSQKGMTIVRGADGTFRKVVR